MPHLMLPLCVIALVATVATADATGGGRHALVVGVSHYPHLDEAYQLEGPEHDAELIAGLARDAFGIPAANVVVLSEAAGAADPSRLPSRAHIEREFRRLADTVQPGDYVWIYLAGHGSQQPADEDFDELDGLDEIFLPRDVTGWDMEQGVVVNAILDDEIGAWLDLIRERRASVWLVIDACHSGTMLRGPGERVRNVPPTALGIPVDALAASRPRTRGGPAGDEPVLRLGEHDGVCAIYACHPYEVTVERTMPRGAADAKPHGLFTYTLAAALSTATSGPSRPITYRELVQRTVVQYASMGRSSPTPLLEGGDLDREILGEQSWQGRSRIVLDELGRINAGMLHGMTVGSILEVKPPAGTGEEILGHVRVLTARMLDSDVEPVEYNGVALAERMPARARCQPVFVDAGDMRLRVAIDEQDRHGNPLADDTRRSLATAVSEALGDNLPVELVDATEKADWLLRPDGGHVYLVPAARSSDSVAARVPHSGPVSVGDESDHGLKSRLARIARAENLCRLAADTRFGVLGESDTLRLEVEVRRCVDEADALGSIPVSLDGRHATFFDGDRAVFEVVNAGQEPVDITMFYVDSAYGITCLFPRDARYNRVPPGRSIGLQVEFENQLPGVEHLVVIGLRGQGDRADLSALEQPSFAAAESVARTRGAAGHAGMDSPLARLLSGALYANAGGSSPATRGFARDDVANHTLQIVTWRVETERRDRP